MRNTLDGRSAVSLAEASLGSNSTGGPLKVLAVIGSPRQGHSYELVRRIEQLLRQDRDVTVDYVPLADVPLEQCRGCYVCQSQGEQHCPLKDDLGVLIARMKQADGVILVSPAYTGNVTALMKNLMDRMAWAAHRPPFIGKPAMLVSTASMQTGDTLRALSWFGYTGFDIVAKIGRPVWPSRRRAWRLSGADERELHRAVNRLTRAMSRPAHSLSPRHVLQFYVSKTTPVTDPEFFRADDEYHRDVDALGYNVAPWKKVFGEIAYRVLTVWLGRQLGTKE